MADSLGFEPRSPEQQSGALPVKLQVYNLAIAEDT